MSRNELFRFVRDRAIIAVETLHFLQIGQFHEGVLSRVLSPIHKWGHPEWVPRSFSLLGTLEIGIRRQFVVFFWERYRTGEPISTLRGRRTRNRPDFGDAFFRFQILHLDHAAGDGENVRHGVRQDRIGRVATTPVALAPTHLPEVRLNFWICRQNSTKLPTFVEEVWLVTFLYLWRRNWKFEKKRMAQGFRTVQFWRQNTVCGGGRERGLFRIEARVNSK